MRLKKIPGALERVEASSYVIKDGKKYVGHYQSLFPKKQPIHIEIGMGKGKFIVEMAERHPEINYIGIEKYDSVLMRALEKQEEKQRQKQVQWQISFSQFPFSPPPIHST